MARILTVSSWVARGHVGNAATTFALMRRGHEVMALPTVVLAHHPGHAPGVVRVDMPDVFAMGGDALQSPRPYPVDAVLAGYVALAPQAGAIAGLVAQARALRADPVPLLLDPVCGDHGALYVDPAVVDEIRARLLPMADIVTPNVTELAALVAPGELDRAPLWPLARIVEAARALDRPAVVVTSAPAGQDGQIANLVVTAGGVRRIELPRVDAAVNGTGDLFSGLLLCGLMEDAPLADAAAGAAAAVRDVLAETRRLGADELALAAAQDFLTEPRVNPRIEPLDI